MRWQSCRFGKGFDMDRTIIHKITSRKFWICAAAFLGSVAASVSGISTNNNIVAAVGIICGVLSAAIYAGAEAYVDAANKDAEVYIETETEEE